MNMQERCAYLESLGFEIFHEDSRVYRDGIEFDFSATMMDVDSILRVVIKYTYSLGKRDGKEDHEYKLRKLCGL